MVFVISLLGQNATVAVMSYSGYDIEVKLLYLIDILVDLTFLHSFRRKGAEVYFNRI